MTTFYVGQRVRIKWSINFHELSGTLGTVISEFRMMKRKEGVYTGGYFCRPDVWDTDIAPGWESPFAPEPEQLEPATDSYDLISWESMRDLWMPEHLRESA